MRVTHSRVSNQFRKQKRHGGMVELDNPADGAAWIEQLPDPRDDGLAALCNREWEKTVIDAAIDRVKRRVPAEQFQLFDFNVLREWPVKKVATTFDVSAARVYLAKHRVAKLIRLEARQIEREFV